MTPCGTKNAAPAGTRAERQQTLGPQKKSFAQVLIEMPNVGLDSDFQRIEDTRNDDVFS